MFQSFFFLPIKYNLGTNEQAKMNFNPFKILEYFTFGKNRLEQEKEELNKEVAALSSNLIPYTKADSDLLSFACVDKSHRGDTLKGIFVSIYDEPMVAFVVKDYKSSKLNRLIAVNTANHKLVYIKTPKSVQVFFNDQQIGFMTEDYKFYGMKKRLVGRVNSGGKGSYSSVVYKDKELGIINDLAFDSPFPKRVFDIINDKLTAEGEIILISMSFYFLVDKFSKS